MSGGFYKRFAHLWEPLNYLKNKGHDVKAIDATVEPYKLEMFDKVIEDRDLIAVCLQFYNIRKGMDVAKFSKYLRPGTPVIAYGPGAWLTPKTLIEDSEFDAVVDTYQAEYGISEGINVLLEGKGESYAPKHLLLKSNPKSDRRPFERLPMEEVGFPDIQALPIDSYKRIQDFPTEDEKRELKPHVTVSRGCDHACSFCEMHAAYGDASYRDPESLAKYMDEATKYTQTFGFTAPTFSGDRKWVRQFAEAVEEHRLDINWSCATRLDTLDDEVLGYMSEAGCQYAGVGVETLQPNDQRRIGKIVSEDFLKTKVKKMKDYGIDPKAFIIVGLPGQSSEEILYTKNFLEEIGARVRPKAFFDTWRYRKKDSRGTLSRDVFHEMERHNYLDRDFPLSKDELREVFGPKLK